MNRKSTILDDGGFSFSGKMMMTLGVTIIVFAIVFVGVIKQSSIVSFIFVVFGGVVIIAGYLLHRWEDKPWGHGKYSDTSETALNWSHGEAYAIQKVLKNERLKKSEDAAAGVSDQSTVERLCTKFFYDSKRRLPCIPECNYWLPEAQRCFQSYQIYECQYPQSRKPVMPSAMKEPVEWCPGPGDCVSFQHGAYFCALKREGCHPEHRFQLNFAKRDRWIGISMMATCSILGLYLFNFFAGMQNVAAGLAALLFGLFFAAIGFVIWQSSS